MIEQELQLLLINSLIEKTKNDIIKWISKTEKMIFKNIKRYDTKIDEFDIVILYYKSKINYFFDVVYYVYENEKLITSFHNKNVELFALVDSKFDKYLINSIYKIINR